MKFWKYSMFTAVVFMSIASAVTYTSCTRDSCKAIKCRNGGVCNDQFCMCPDGYEGTQCEILSRQKFIGRYYGITKINDLPVTRDSAEITSYIGSSIAVETWVYSRLPEKMNGKAMGDEVYINSTDGKAVTLKMIGDNKIEMLIDEVVDGKRMITNFSGTKN